MVAEVNGDQIRLSKDKKETERLFHDLMAKKPDEDPEPATVFGPTFKKLADDYLKATRGDKDDRVFLQRTTALQLFCNHVPRKTRAKDLKPHMVSAWLKTKTTWGVSTRPVKRKTIKAALNWGVKEGHLDENPLKKMAGGESLRRDRVLAEDEKKKIRELVTPDFADFLRAIELTGCRPFSEVAQLEASMIDFDAGTATIQKHKNRKKTGTPRVLFLVPEVLEILRSRKEKHPEGALFRRPSGSYTMSAAGTITGPKPFSLPRRYPHEYSIWTGMKQRCTNTNCREYRYYGGRGIRVCRRWTGTDGFKHFFADLGPQPFKRASVHRVDNNRRYTPGNVVWADPKTQARHMSTNRILRYHGEKMILVEWAERMSIKPGTLGAAGERVAGGEGADRTREALRFGATETQLVNLTSCWEVI